MSNHLSGLIHRPGITSWIPTVDRAIKTDFATFADYLQSLPEDKRAESKMIESHWPPPANEVDNLNLTRCIRIYPHLQNTGGFFIAVLQKARAIVALQTAVSQTSQKDGKRHAEEVDDLDTSDAKKAKIAEEQHVSLKDDIIIQRIGIDEDDEVDTTEANGPISAMDVDQKLEIASEVSPDQFKQQQSRKGKGKSSEGGTHFKENPYTFVAPDDPIIQTCISKLHLKPDFPASNMLVRNPAGDPVRSLYMTNDIVKHIVMHNDFARMRLMTCGTKVFAKQEGAEAKREGAEMQFRVLSEGLPVVLPYIDPQAVLPADVTALKTFMQAYYPLCSSFGDPFRSLIESKAPGSYIVRFEPGQAAGATLVHDLVLPIWKSTVSATLMLDKKAKSALSLRLCGEDITTAARDAAKKKQQEQRPTPTETSALDGNTETEG